MGVAGDHRPPRSDPNRSDREQGEESLHVSDRTARKDRPRAGLQLQFSCSESASSRPPSPDHDVGALVLTRRLPGWSPASITYSCVYAVRPRRNVPGQVTRAIARYRTSQRHYRDRLRGTSVPGVWDFRLPVRRMSARSPTPALCNGDLRQGIPREWRRGGVFDSATTKNGGHLTSVSPDIVRNRRSIVHLTIENVSTPGVVGDAVPVRARRLGSSGDTVEQMRAWDHWGGLSIDASVCVGARDRAGLERPLRYCARPPMAGGRLRWDHDSGDAPGAGSIPPVRYLLPKPDRDGRTVIELTPLELLDRLAVLIPPPRKHRHRYHGVLAPNRALRPAVRATALWAFLIFLIYEAFPLACPNCANAMSLIAFITEPASVARILEHLELPPTPPPLAPSRGPPLDDADHARTFDPTAAEPVPDFEFDQRVSW